MYQHFKRQVLRISIGKNLFYFIETFPEVCVSIRRMHQFLLLPEFTSPAELDVKTTPQRVILKNASFAWGLDLSTFDRQREEAAANLTKIMAMKDAQNSLLAEHAIGNSQLSTRLSLDMKLAQKIGRLVSDS